MKPHVDYKTRYVARIGDKFIHQSLERLTSDRTWAWTPTTEQLKKAKCTIDLVRQARPVRILQQVKLKTGGVMQ